MMSWFRKRKSPDQRATQWLDWLEAGDTQAILEDLNRHPDTLQNTSVPLIPLAILAGNALLLEAFLQHGADPKTPDRYGIFPLLMAIEQPGRLSLVTTLLKHGANPDLQDRFGATALMYASLNGHEEVVAELLQADAKPDLRDQEGNTALLYAAGRQHLACVCLLLTAGADAAIRNHDGLDALDRATDPDLEQEIRQALER